LLNNLRLAVPLLFYSLLMLWHWIQWLILYGRRLINKRDLRFDDYWVVRSIGQ